MVDFDGHIDSLRPFSGTRWRIRQSSPRTVSVLLVPMLRPLSLQGRDRSESKVEWGEGYLSVAQQNSEAGDASATMRRLRILSRFLTLQR